MGIVCSLGGEGSDGSKILIKTVGRSGGVVETGEYLTMAQCSQWTEAVRIRISGDENSKHHQIVFQRSERGNGCSVIQTNFVRFSLLRHRNYWYSQFRKA